LNRILGADSQDRSQNQGSRHCDFFSWLVYHGYSTA
jgi:hypothetical protein